MAGGLDKGRWPSHEIAAGKDAANVRRVRARVNPDAAAIDLEIALDRQERVICGLTDRRDDRVGGDLELGALDGHGSAAARRVRLAEAVADELDGADLAIVVAQDLDRTDQELHAHAF